MVQCARTRKGSSLWANLLGVILDDRAYCGTLSTTEEGEFLVGEPSWGHSRRPSILWFMEHDRGRGVLCGRTFLWSFSTTEHIVLHSARPRNGSSLWTNHLAVILDNRAYCGSLSTTDEGEFFAGEPSWGQSRRPSILWFIVHDRGMGVLCGRTFLR